MIIERTDVYKRQVYGCISMLLAWITNKSRRVAGIINGRPLILFRNGKLIKKSFKKARLDVDEFVMHCRSGGYFDLSQIECVILEANGKLSIMPKSENRPLTPQDMGIPVERATLYTAVIVDGVVDWNRLREEGLDKKWLDRQLHAMDIGSPREVFYAAVSEGIPVSYTHLDVYKRQGIGCGVLLFQRKPKRACTADVSGSIQRI